GFGLLPLALGISIDLAGAEIEVGGPVASQWMQLANAVVFGLAFGTVLTLIVTPALLALPYKLRSYRDQFVSLFRRTKPVLSD
ncbi:MAG: hypothetical protein Q8L06_16310, partial [Pseudohongiella sp.]|nr:hypothetical protein [Pseudohongiella sp.]